MERSGIIERFLDYLDKEFPDANCELKHKNVYELTIATILSAQCTDEVVNKVTPHLFSQFPDFPSLASADIDVVKAIIKPTGFFNNKANSIINLAKIITKEHKNILPLNMAKLVKLPGIGRKTANVILGEYSFPVGIVVDTHVSRISKRLGLTNHQDPLKIEKDLMALIPQHKWRKVSHQMIHFGRKVCKARKPLCSGCGMNSDCIYISNNSNHL
ncbi:MAG: endonuclease III [Calditerrivibrio sp.]|nr:endonuclease III [Calditerrivibrio sp.]